MLSAFSHVSRRPGVRGWTASRFPNSLLSYKGPKQWIDPSDRSAFTTSSSPKDSSKTALHFEDAPIHGRRENPTALSQNKETCHIPEANITPKILARDEERTSGNFDVLDKKFGVVVDDASERGPCSSPSNEYSGRFDTGETQDQPLPVHSFPSQRAMRRLTARKSNWRSPTEHLIDALSRATPDIRYWKPQKRNAKEVLQRVSLQMILADYLEHADPIFKHGEDQKLSNVNEARQLDGAIDRVFNDVSLQVLAKAGYTVEDVMAWAWILKTKESYRAVIRLFHLMDTINSHRITPINSVPRFVPLLLLRRRHIGIQAFRLLLMYSLLLLDAKMVPNLMSLASMDVDSVEAVLKNQVRQEHAELLEPESVNSWIKRLLYHASRILPSAHPVVARALARYLAEIAPMPDADEKIQDQRDKKRASCYNAALYLFSLPCKLGPFHSRYFQQEAQFELLKSMAANGPALAVNRQSYRAIISVQLGHMKTSEERESAVLKAPSWPPWKEARLGIDAERGNEGMKSRAVKALDQMKEAGYARSVWEEVAGILGGWNTDGTPTIQTRALVKPREYSPRDAESHIWAARVRATRTLREAWSCFLSHESQGLPPHEKVYFAMAEKLIYAQNAFEKSFTETSSALPGDGLEVSLEPVSARDLVYVPIEPPSLDDFLQQMVSRGIKPSNPFLALLLKFAPTLQRGLSWIRCSGLPGEVVDALCCVDTAWSQPEETRRAFERFVPDYLFYAYMEFVCKFCKANDQTTGPANISASDLFPISLGNFERSGHWAAHYLPGLETTTGGRGNDPKILLHVLRLMLLLRPTQPAAWHVLLKAVSSPRVGVHRTLRGPVQRILCWHEVIEVLRWMNDYDVDPAMDSFMTACLAFSRTVHIGIQNETAIDEALQHIKYASERRGISPANVSHNFEMMVHEGLALLKGYFDRLILAPPLRSTSDKAECREGNASLDGELEKDVRSPLLQVPGPAMLHRFVRTLGIAEDYDGLLSLLRWMSQHAAAIQDMADQYLNGKRLMRRALIAVRVFLEGYHVDHITPASLPTRREPLQLRKRMEQLNEAEEYEKAPEFGDASVQEAYRIFEDTAVWGGWPTDKEVEAYLQEAEPDLEN